MRSPARDEHGHPLMNGIQSPRHGRCLQSCRNSESRWCELDPAVFRWEAPTARDLAGSVNVKDRVFATGDDADSLRRIANCGDLSLKALCRSLTSTADWDDNYPFTAPVGSFQATAFGIYDMHGNVGEWCLDWFDADYFAKSRELDPQGPEKADTWRVVRGGSWYNNPFSCRSSGRHDGVRIVNFWRNSSVSSDTAPGMTPKN